MPESTPPSCVDLYWDGHFVLQIKFKHKWEAWLFHKLLNRSFDTAGVKKY